MLIFGNSPKKLCVLRLRLFLHVVHLLKEKVIEKVKKKISPHEIVFYRPR